MAVSPVLEKFKKRAGFFGARMWIWICATPFALVPVGYRLASRSLLDTVLLLACLAVALLGAAFVGFCAGLFAVDYVDAVGHADRWQALMRDPMSIRGVVQMLQDRAKKGPLGRELTERELTYVPEVCRNHPPPEYDGEKWSWVDDMLAEVVRKNEETRAAIH